MLAPRRCHHCDEPLLPGVDFTLRLDGELQGFCCAGCRAATELICDAGLSDYYRFRTDAAPRPDPGAVGSFAAFAKPGDALVPAPPGLLAVNLLVEGLRCPACGWLVERAIGRLPGVNRIEVNPATGRARLEWREPDATLPELLQVVDRLGYRPHLLGQADTLAVALGERRQALKRLALAGFGMMQVATFAVAMYAGAFDGMDPQLREFLRLVSLLVATPVLLYSGRPFLSGAWRSVAARQLSIDLPVGLALVLAYSASVWNTLAGSGEVYFDSVTMFIFLLLLGRYAEMSARHHAGSSSDALLRLQPREARRHVPGGLERVRVAELCTGDRVEVAAGEAFPADGVIEGPASAADESLVTGESAAVPKPLGASVLAGSLNAGPSTTLVVTMTGADTALAAIVRLLERAQSERPRLALIADRWAGWFLARVLGGAVVVAALWIWIDPSRAFEITLSVLVVTCPCALSLATPSAIAAATSGLARAGILPSRADALERLATIDHVLLDKTGTLTRGRPRLQAWHALSGGDPRKLLGIAAALERGSSHPLSRAFEAVDVPVPTASDIVEAAGFGIEGRVAGCTYRLGRRDWVAELAGAGVDPDAGMYLARRGQWLMALEVEDPLRPDARAAVEALQALGLTVEIASGDTVPAVAAAATQLGIRDWRARMTPEDKLARVRAASGTGRKVLAVGDGINDAPVLQAAQVSVALGSGAALAQTAADLVLLGPRLEGLPLAIRHARQTLAVTRQNLAWAAAYNLAALPAAALGYVPPWLAAIGMSLSSLVVVLNASRLRRLP